MTGTVKTADALTPVDAGATAGRFDAAGVGEATGSAAD